MNHYAAALILALVPLSAPAQDRALDFQLVEVMALASEAHAGGAAFAASLRQVMPSVWVHEASAMNGDMDDPFLWSFSGTFGGPGAVPRPGAIFACARYGLHTRDLFAERGFSSPDMIDLMRAVMPLSDDPALWPEDAVARLHCSFVWDDVETVAILDREAAIAGLGQVFALVEVAGDRTLYAPLYGEDGFAATGTGGSATSVVVVESGEVILTAGHQQVTFRAFLLGGGA